MMKIVEIERDNRADRQFMEELYLCYESLMFKIAFKYTTKRVEAEDIVQESLVRLFSRIHDLQQIPEKARARYITLTVESAAVDELRSKKREESRQDGTPYDDESATHSDHFTYDEELFNRLSAKELAGKLDLLEPRDRLLLEYKYFMEYTDQEIAAVLKIKSQNVRTYLMRAKQRLAHLISRTEK